MPKELTHWIIAERAYAGLEADSPIRGVIEAHRGHYLAGAVLPDTLMHIFRGPHARTALELSKRFHDADGNSYAPLIRAEERFPDGIPPTLLASLLGVLAHMQADIVFHPFVFAVAGIRDMGRHYRLETAIDVSFILRGAVLPARRLGELVTSQTRDDLVTACSLLFDPEGELPRSAMEQALGMHCRFQGMFDRTSWKILARILGSLPGSPLREKRHLFYPLVISHDDEMITGHGEWRHPATGERCSSSVGGLAEQAVRRTIAVMERIVELGSLAAALADPPGENLLTGLCGVKKREMVLSA